MCQAVFVCNIVSPADKHNEKCPNDGTLRHFRLYCKGFFYRPYGPGCNPVGCVFGLAASESNVTASIGMAGA